jgi:3',5'-cyclic AMP phosphodiesterase CpdA
MFLDTLPKPQIIVPGNHDVPLHNVFARFLQPLKKYRRFITSDLEPFFLDEEVAVLGVNTARSFTVKNGCINTKQIEQVRARFSSLSSQIIKIVVTHHPFDLPDRYLREDLVGRAPRAMQAFVECGADVLLAGHMHLGHVGDTGARYKIAGYSALVVQAGTATSSRGRGKNNSFNVFRIAPTRTEIDRYDWTELQFAFIPVSTTVFARVSDGWIKAEAG